MPKSSAEGRKNTTDPTTDYAGAGSHDRISRSSLSTQIVERLRNDIVNGRIPAGTPLVQDELCERFSTSRMPVRDALQQLAHEGLLEQQGQHRVVAAIGAEDLEEAYGLIAVLHGWAAGRAAAFATEDELDRLERVCQDVVATEDQYDYGILAMQFHREINLLSHSPRLVRTMSTFQRTIPRMMPFTIEEELGPSKARYLAIVAAVRSRDRELAERLTRAHSLISVGLLTRSLERH